MMLLKLDDQGNIEFRKDNSELGGTGKSVVPMADGGYVVMVAPGGPRIFLVKTNEYGDTVSLPD